jgi:hypothetical protein
MENEIWKSIKDYEGIYEVSNLGNIKSIERLLPHFCGGKRILKERILKIKTNKYGYCSVCLSKNNNCKSFLLHRLVIDSFIKNDENKPQVNHIDGNKSNNNINNLEWVSAKENYFHSVKIGLRKHYNRTKETKEKMSISALKRNPNCYKKAWDTKRKNNRV